MPREGHDQYELEAWLIEQHISIHVPREGHDYILYKNT